MTNPNTENQTVVSDHAFFELAKTPMIAFMLTPQKFGVQCKADDFVQINAQSLISAAFAYHRLVKPASYTLYDVSALIGKIGCVANDAENQDKSKLDAVRVYLAKVGLDAGVDAKNEHWVTMVKQFEAFASQPSKWRYTYEEAARETLLRSIVLAQPWQNV